MDTEYTDRNWQSPDGLTLYFRDYDGPSDKPPVICLHGLTRNSRDFSDLAAHLAGDWRVIVPDMRGRGKSEYASDSSTYQVPTYIGDLLALLEQERIDRFVSIGTSMGGIMTMVMAGLVPDRIAGAVINDIGPVVETGGIDKIKTYVGQGRSFPTWMHAARALEETHGAAHPNFDINDWIVMAKRGLTVCNNGRIAFDYDMKIAEPILSAEDTAVPPDLWPAFEALSAKPMLIVRGGLSNLLSESTFAEMQKRAPSAATVTIDKVGHAPTLDEPDARAAIDTFLSAIA